VYRFVRRVVVSVSRQTLFGEQLPRPLLTVTRAAALEPGSSVVHIVAPCITAAELPQRRVALRDVRPHDHAVVGASAAHSTHARRCFVCSCSVMPQAPTAARSGRDTVEGDDGSGSQQVNVPLMLIAGVLRMVFASFDPTKSPACRFFRSVTVSWSPPENEYAVSGRQ
jgi:hypothetical protein